MEKTNEFILPDMSKIKKKKIKPATEPTKLIVEERERLPRTNRTIKCAFCSTEKILNPDQYQSLYDYWGNEDKIQREFMCKDCDIEQKTNPVLFGMKYSELLPTLTRKIRAAFEVYNASNKDNADIVALQNMVNAFLGECHIDTRSAEYGTEPAPRGFTVKTLKLNHFPFIGNITLYPYETTQNRVRFN